MGSLIILYLNFQSLRICLTRPYRLFSELLTTLMKPTMMKKVWMKNVLVYIWRSNLSLKRKKISIPNART